MDKAEFIEATNRVEHYFNKSYEIEQLKIMFEFFKDWRIERYRKAINYCIENCNFLPKIKDFKNAEIDLPQVTNKEQIEFMKCKKCNGEGFIKYFRVTPNGEKPITYEYIALCTCTNAQKQREINKYNLPTLAEIGM